MANIEGANSAGKVDLHGRFGAFASSWGGATDWGIAPVAGVGFLFLAFPDRRSASKANLASKEEIWSVPIENATKNHASAGVNEAAAVAKFRTMPDPTISVAGRGGLLDARWLQGLEDSAD